MTTGAVTDEGTNVVGVDYQEYYGTCAVCETKILNPDLSQITGA